MCQRRWAKEGEGSARTLTLARYPVVLANWRGGQLHWSMKFDRLLVSGNTKGEGVEGL